MKDNKIQIAILGLGTVGTGVYKVLKKQQPEMLPKLGVEVEVSRVLVRNLERAASRVDYPSILTNNWEDIISDDTIDIIVEVMGGMEPARTYILDALHAGKNVVTANKDLIAASEFEAAMALGCFDRETLISQIAVYPLKANIYDSVYPIGFVTSVCTYPEYTGHGIMKRLMYQALVHMRERKQPFGMLFPYSIPLYRRFGWEIISNKISFTVKDRQIPSKAKAPGYVRRVNWENKDFMNLHTRFASSTHGCLFRNSLAWEEYWRWDEDDTVVAVYYDQHATPMGYMVYLIKDDIMHIKEMIYINREAHEGLWEYIRAHDSMIDEVRGNSYFNEPIAFEMDDGDIREMIRPYIMGRIVDVEEFLHLYHCSPEEKGVCFDLDIDDAFLPWNNRPFRVWFEGGNCTLTDRDPDYELRMSIATLSTLLIGYKTAAKLARIGRITGSDEAIARLDHALLHEAPYISDYI